MRGFFALAFGAAAVGLTGCPQPTAIAGTTNMHCDGIFVRLEYSHFEGSMTLQTATATSRDTGSNPYITVEVFQNFHSTTAPPDAVFELPVGQSHVFNLSNVTAVQLHGPLANSTSNLDCLRGYYQFP
jgi:hypothetical protein